MLDLTVLVPTRNEAANVLVLFDAIEATLGSTTLDWQVMFVDDSDDETVSVLASMAATRPRCALLHRFGPERVGGLSGAVVAGLHASSSRLVAVMDGDLQHPPAVLPALVAPLVDGTAEVVVASRYRDGACPDGLSGPGRRAVSSGARTFVHVLFPRLRHISDPLGGLFAFERDVVDEVDLQPCGFKILMEVLQRGRWTVAAEVPYTFAPRGGGHSKAGLREGMRFLRHAARLRLAPTGAGTGSSLRPRATRATRATQRIRLHPSA